MFERLRMVIASPFSVIETFGGIRLRPRAWRAEQSRRGRRARGPRTRSRGSGQVFARGAARHAPHGVEARVVARAHGGPVGLERDGARLVRAQRREGVEPPRVVPHHERLGTAGASTSTSRTWSPGPRRGPACRGRPRGPCRARRGPCRARPPRRRSRRARRRSPRRGRPRRGSGTVARTSSATRVEGSTITRPPRRATARWRSGDTAGPTSTRPLPSKREPWHTHSLTPIASGSFTRQRSCVHSAEKA